jgi:hypothetical protein
LVAPAGVAARQPLRRDGTIVVLPALAPPRATYEARLGGWSRPPAFQRDNHCGAAGRLSRHRH